MSTIGQNIANVNTEGYSRQRVTLAASRAVPTSYGFLGSGVSVQTIERIHSNLVDQQLMSERPSFSQFEFKKTGLEFVEEIFNEPSDYGINRNLEEFFNSFQDLANDPESTAARTVVRQKAQTLTNSFNRIHQQLTSYQDQLNSELADSINEVNLITSEIAKLNERIVNAEVTGHEAPTLRDERDLLVKDLSRLVDVRTFENGHGAINVAVGNRMVVVDTYSERLALTTVSEGDPGPKITFERDDVVASVTNGKIKGLLDLRDSDIPDYINQLNSLAVGLTEEVNAIHNTGFNLDGISGIDIFDASTSDASDFAVSVAVLSNANLIAASDTLNEPGNNTIALQIVDLADSLTMNNGEFTFSDFYNSLISGIGSQTQEAGFLENSFSLTVEKLEFTRESISGVSLDEEMTNMIEAQQAFTAATRVIATVDEMTRTILDMV